MKPVIAIFDLGRTNKKFILFDTDYKVVQEETQLISDIADEDGDPCEDIQAISIWIKDRLEAALLNDDFSIKAVNFSAHGASFVHLDQQGNPVTPMYDYMKMLDVDIAKSFYDKFGGKINFSQATGSPVLNLLNSGVQLYWLKNTRKDDFNKIRASLHYPQYANFIFSKKIHADFTSIGCHTGLWDYEKMAYHPWLKEEKLDRLLPPGESVETCDWVRIENKEIPFGIGIHDSSAALLPFTKTAEKPFILLSTGTWNISLNPYFKGELKEGKYERDCLYFLSDARKKVAASRLFLGNEYDFQVRRLERHFHKEKGYAHTVKLNVKILRDLLKNKNGYNFYPETMVGTGPFPNLKGPSPQIPSSDSFEKAYHRLMLDLVYLQSASIALICGEIKRLYLVGGFIKNDVFMELLAAFLPDWELFVAENKRASGLGAALALHEVWQTEPISKKISPVIPFRRHLDIDLSRYRPFGMLEKSFEERE